MAVTALSSLWSLPSAWAESAWLPSGDAQLRLDLQLLSDAGVIRYPISQWPIPRVALQAALDDAKEHVAVNAAVQAALARVRTRVAGSPAGLRFAAAARAGEGGIWRDFDTLAREDAEVSGTVEHSAGRWSMGLTGTVVTSPGDGQRLRADGSHLTLQLGNWLLSAHTLDRWWGPGHGGSLILSSNARPMPTVMVERAEARPFESRWLSWLGPWRFSFAVSQMEEERQDIDSPLFMAWRVAVMPFHDIELGLSRTAQFCGDGLPCTAKSFVDLLIGNDNPGFDATPESEPGNQMAGFDLRWNSPIGEGPYAFYGQYIGEDESSYLPVKYLGLLGLEFWKPFADGAVLQTHLEYTNTTCSGLASGGPLFDCAYNQGKFNVEGYRYRGRVIGHTTDADAESWVLGASLAQANGALWTASARKARLNRDKFDTRNTASQEPADYASLEFGWNGRLWGESLTLQLGVEALQPKGADRDVEPFGFVGWRHDFAP